MPELPEVEVTRRGLESQLAGRTICGVEIRQSRLRWPVSPALGRLAGRTVDSVRRRAKYLIIGCGDGHLILHLGMSGSLRLVPAGTPAGRHDHFDLLLGDFVLRLRDPRRFGAVLWTPGPPEAHPLLSHLGIEPLSPALAPARLRSLVKGRRTAIKQFLMDARQVVGIGNIYANESLFLAGIAPRMPAGRLSIERCGRLTVSIKRTLRAAIRAGGSTLRDFVGAHGEAGCFQQQYWVYDREGKPCLRCGTTIRRIVQGQRSTFYCPRCQR